VEWKNRAGITALCKILEINESDYRLARAQIKYVYVERPQLDKKSGKVRDLCYPSQSSMLYIVLSLLKDRVLEKLEVLPEVRGYRKGSHNINTASDVCGHRLMGKVDISKFHPSINRRHIAAALWEHGVSASWSREIARIVTYKGSLPQGAPTSNHIANIVMDSLLRRFVRAFCDGLGVQFRNFGDDIAFYGSHASAVLACVKHVKNAFRVLGFKANEKCRDSEHRGGRREFIGCATGRERPDYPRRKYRAFRKELRALVQSERCRGCSKPMTTPRHLNSLRHRIAYVNRLNRVKARNLLDLFYRLCRARRGRPNLPRFDPACATMTVSAYALRGSALNPRPFG
jgi:hypothetical protein